MSQRMHLDEACRPSWIRPGSRVKNMIREFKHYGSRAAAVGVAALITIVVAVAPSAADDTEIFFGQGGNSLESNPNLLFLLDNSGSMNLTDTGVSGTRADRMKAAMRLLLDQASSFNVGLASFQGADRGASIRYPIGWLESSTESFCGDEGCPDELVTARPVSEQDTAVQNDDTNEVDLNTLVLSLGDRHDQQETETDSAAVFTRTVKATSDSVEWFGKNAPGLPTGTLDNTTTDWFFSGDQNDNPSRVGLRFDAIDLPADAVVQTAYITFTRTDLADQTGAMSARFFAESNSTATPFSLPSDDESYMSLVDRNNLENRTQASVAWDNIPPFTADGFSDDSGAKVQSADLSPVLTEVAGLNGWSETSNVNFIIAPPDQYLPSADNIRRFYGAGATEDLRPELTFTYLRAADATGTESQTLLASAHLDEFNEGSTGVAWTNQENMITPLFHVGDTYTPRSLALRFENVNVPQGATVTSSQLILRMSGGTAATDPNEYWTRDPSAPPADPNAVDPADEGNGEPNLGAGNPGFSIKIQAEQTGNPEAYSTDGNAGRDFNGAERTWTDLADGDFTELSSPNIAELITQVTSRADWTPGNDISILISPNDDYADLPDNIRKIYTPVTPFDYQKPVLDIVWDTADSGEAEELGTQTTAIRFDRVFVPPRATIVSARMIFTAAQADDVATNLEIGAHASGAPEALTDTPNDIGMRPSTNKVLWNNVEPWDVVGQEYASPDISSLVSELVEDSTWCGGNPMVFMVSGNGTRVAETYLDASSGVPRLEITYTPSTVDTGGYCSNTSLDAPIADSISDAVQAGSGALVTNGNNLGTNSELDGSGSAQSIGLHFRDLPIPQGTRIISAALRVTPRNDIADTATLAISVDEADSSVDFGASAINATNRNWSPTVSWELNGPVNAGEPVVSTDITDLVKAVTERGGWSEGNGLSFRIEQASGSHRHFISSDSDEQLAPDLIIFYESERTDESALFREALKRQVNELGIGGYTPIVSSLYESIRYMSGRSVDYGKTRGKPWDSGARLRRVSHPYSYTGGYLNRPNGCTDLSLNWNACRNEEITGNPVYTSPITSQCQTNHIVLLSDGAALRDADAADDVRTLTGASCDTSHANVDEHCGRELSDWIESEDHSPLPGDQSVEVHTIAFSLDDADASQFLEDLATTNGGSYDATTADELLAVFQTIFSKVSKTEASFVSPTVTVSSQNRLRNRDDVYYTLFKPQQTARWGGNLKRYRASSEAGATSDILDVDGNLAVDSSTGQFEPGARSWWSSTTDGGRVLEGGAAEQLELDYPDNSNRRVSTFTGLEDGGTTQLLTQANSLDKGNTRIDQVLYDIPPPFNSDADYVAELIDWSRGRDTLDQDGDGNVVETRPQMGDPMHSQPALLNYAGDKSIVFVATNEGFVHAIDSDTGEEQWAWIPQELLKNLHDYYQNAPVNRRPYGLDGGITSWVDDTDRDGIIDPGDKAILYLGMRRGGNAYYALDVSDISNPKFMWKISGGAETEDLDDTTANGDFSELGQSWSRPVRTKVIDGDPSDENSVRDVIIFGGGYSTNQDQAASGDPAAELRSEDGVGAALFIVDALTGEQVWRAEASLKDFAAMKYSIPSDLATIDIDFDGAVDQIYFGDMGGQVWRVDFNNSGVNLPLRSRITGGRIGIFANDEAGNTRRFYYPPSVSLIQADGSQQLAISIGSGWRAHPLDAEVQDRFYNIRSPYVFGPPVDTAGEIDYDPVLDNSAPAGESVGFANITDNVAPDMMSIVRGWYMDIGVGVDDNEDRPGEKVLAKPLTINGNVIFTTYTPEFDLCKPANGSSNVYMVNVLDGSPTSIFRTDGQAVTLSDRYRSLNQAGLAPGPSIHFPESGLPTIMVGTEKLEEVDFGATRRRTFWQEMIEDDASLTTSEAEGG